MSFDCLQTSTHSTEDKALKQEGQNVFLVKKTSTLCSLATKRAPRVEISKKGRYAMQSQLRSAKVLSNWFHTTGKLS